ncbi:MAG: dihydrofolate reductase family protein [Anaerolineae bacterium]|nr:dihydrofolate reductase family protein [Anaerolineae bacterium]
MGKVMAGFTMSLDGFIAGPGGDVQQLFKWYSMGDTDFPLPGTDLVFKVSRASAERMRQAWASFGAFMTGRGDFDASNAWGGQVLLGVPTFIVTHHPPQEWLRADSPFTFVTEGVEAALERATAAAGDKNVAVGGTTIVQQLLNAGLLDEISIELVPLLLGKGIRLFDHLTTGPTELETIKVIEAPGVTHLTYRVVK